MPQQFSTPSMHRAHLRQTEVLKDYARGGLAVDDPRNAVYLTKGGRVVRAWPLDEDSIELVQANTGKSETYRNREVAAMVAEGVLTEITVPVGRGQRMLGVPGEEELEVPKMSAKLTGKYKKGGLIKPSVPEPLEMLPIVDIDGPALNSPAARLMNKYRKSNT